MTRERAKYVRTYVNGTRKTALEYTVERMRRGQRVVLVDLVGRSDLNGRTGFVCKAADDPNGRIGVQLQPGEEQPVALRSQNLVLGAAVPELPSELWDAIFCRSDRRAILRQRAVSAQWQGAISSSACIWRRILLTVDAKQVPLPPTVANRLVCDSDAAGAHPRVPLDAFLPLAPDEINTVLPNPSASAGQSPVTPATRG